MTTKAEWLKLARLCEAQTGSDRALDHQILLALGWTADGWRWNLPSGDFLHPTVFPSASLDAITALIERELPDMEGIIPLKGKQEAWLWPSRGIAKGWRCTAATPALALCAAFCRAMAEKDNEDDNQS